MINVALAANGLSEAFIRAGFEGDKNFLTLHNGKFLLETVLATNFAGKEGGFLAVIPREQLNSDFISEIKVRLKDVNLDVDFIGAPRTPSAFATLLWASDYFDGEDLTVTPGDALITRKSKNPKNEGCLSSFRMFVARGHEDRWGYAIADDFGNLSKFAAKSPVSSTMFTGEFEIRDATCILKAASKLLLSKDDPSQFHLGDVLTIAAGGEPISLEFVESFIPLASPGDVRNFLEE